MYRCVEDDGKYFCVSNVNDEPNIPCTSENDAENLAALLNNKNKTIDGMTDYIGNLELDLLSVSRSISHVVSKQYNFRDSRRFHYIYNEDDQIYELVDKYGEFGPWASLVESDMQYLINFMNRQEFEKKDLEVDLEIAKEDLNIFKGLPQAHLLHDMTHDLFEINNIVGFFVENDIEPECVKQESEAVREILDRLLIVMEDYK